MNKKILAAFMAAVIAAGAMSMAVTADDEPIKVLINGETLTIPEGDTQPYIEEGRTLVPMRVIFEALGAHVNWDGETKTIVSYDPANDISITMQINSDVMFVGETPVTLDVPAKIVGDRTVVPVRAIAEGMKSVVNWDQETRTVTVTKDAEKADTETETGEDTKDDTKTETQN